MLRETLKQNSSLTHLTLQGNNFDDGAALVWADIISVTLFYSTQLNSTQASLNCICLYFQNTIRIEYLDLSHNNFGEEGGRILGPAIAENASIKYLNLSWNNIRRKGATAIAKGLGVIQFNLINYFSCLFIYLILTLG